MLDLLSRSPDVQERLRTEIKLAKDAWEADHGNRNLDYETLSDLRFLEDVCRETLRL
jgi:cytochrome P450